MDKLTKAFVIAASTVVIAVGGVWLSQQYAVYQAKERCISNEMNSDEFSGAYKWTELEKRDWIYKRGRCR